MLRKQALNNIVLTVPKNRKPKFDLSLHVIDLTNIPLVCGTTYVKWHLPSSNAAEHRGKTDKAVIRDHKATWDYSKELPVRLTIEKNLTLQECDIHFEILQEYNSGGRGGRVLLGNVKLNLAEYTNVPEPHTSDGGDGSEDGMITRRYLMQDSKVNATLKIGLRMKQLEGDTNFIPPPLKSAMVIGGIAGILSTEAGETEDMPSIVGKTREHSEAQDTYRRMLAATWACQAGELPPDRLIEDLFAGGDGGKMEPPPVSRRLERAVRAATTMAAGGPAGATAVGQQDDSSTSSDFDSSARHTPTQSLLSPESARTGHYHHHGHHNHHHHHGHQHGNGSQDGGAGGGGGSQVSIVSAVSGRGSIEQQMQHSQASAHSRRKAHQQVNEVSEFEVRDDLRSWVVKVK